MDWTAQSEAMLKGWTEVHKTMWDAWLKSVREAGRPAAGGDWPRVMEKAGQAWQESVGRALDAQVEWTRIWAESLAPSATGDTAAWAGQFAEGMRRWVAMQKQLWQTWFDMVRALGPVETAGAWETLWKTWETAARQGLDAQAAWARAWPAAPAGTSRPGA